MTLGIILLLAIIFGWTDYVSLSGFRTHQVEIVNFIQESRKDHRGIIINAGGYTPPSVAILDALLAVKKPTIELHITNIYKREDFRHKSLISKAADGIICGLGIEGYIMSLEGIKKIIKNEN